MLLFKFPFRNEHCSLHKKRVKPPKTPRPTTASPYISPTFNTNLVAALLLLPLAAPVSAGVLLDPLALFPPKPVYTTFVPVGTLPSVAVELILLVMVLVFTRVGFCAPHGWSWRQAEAQALFPVPQLLTQMLLFSVQMK